MGELGVGFEEEVHEGKGGERFYDRNGTWQNTRVVAAFGHN
jgi:hypothetical protein